MKVKSYIITHKKTTLPELKGYYSLLVGAYKHKDKEIFDYCDDEGENISAKNANYCELTGLYWIWKHSDADIVGFCHYRRYFTNSLFSSKTKYFLTDSDMETLLQEYDVIVPKARYYKETAYEALNIAPNIADAEEMRRAISKLYPEYLNVYQSYLDSNKCYLFNMFVMKKKLLDQYCEWLFNILNFVESEYKFDKEDPYRSRLFGFLSERLFYVWITKNIPQFKIKECRVVKTDEKSSWLVGQDIKNNIRNLYFHTTHRG